MSLRDADTPWRAAVCSAAGGRLVYASSAPAETRQGPGASYKNAVFRGFLRSLYVAFYSTPAPLVEWTPDRIGFYLRDERCSVDAVYDEHPTDGLCRRLCRREPSSSPAHAFRPKQRSQLQLRHSTAKVSSILDVTTGCRSRMVTRRLLTFSAAGMKLAT